MRVGSLFSGVGGIDLGLERAGMRVAWQCEADAYCRRVLAHHWPDVPCYHDVRDVGTDAPAVDVLAGGFPCQPVSLAGRGLAQADERWLWPEFARCIRVLRPRYVVVENVPGLLARGMGDVLGDLAALGFDAEWTVFGARDVGAPHQRERVWIVAHANGEGQLQPGGAVGQERRWAGDRGGSSGRADVANAEGKRRAAQRPQRPVATRPDADAPTTSRTWPAEPDVGRVAHGVPHRVDRLRALGNAVVPACAEHIGRCLMELA